MKILVCYSRPHFDPAGRKLTYSASFIARAIYEAASEVAEVTYIDPTEAHSVSGQSFDLFIGQISRFSDICKSIRSRCKVLFMATTHPANRNRVLRGEAGRLGVPVTELLEAPADTFVQADFILQIGNDWALHKMLDAGVPREKILNIHYGIEHIPFEAARVFSSPYRFLFLATELGLRKGLARVLSAFRTLSGAYELTLVGRVPSSEYEGLIREAVQKNNRIKHLGWVDSSDAAYRRLLESHHFLIFPSLEEGEAGTVLEALSSGLIPITTGDRTGIAFSPLGTFSLDADNTPLLERAITAAPERLAVLSRQSVHYVQTLHQWAAFKGRLRELAALLLAGKVQEVRRPRVSLILPVFNKEDDVVRLLRQLYTASRSYGNYELHLFFDGCIDQSQQRAKRYLATCDVKVTYYETPNLFETRTNNIGLKAADGKYCVLLQDDLFIYDDRWLEQLVYFMECNPRVGALGGLAGVNYYPSDTELEGPGVSSNSVERSRRIDVRLDPALAGHVHEVDAVMRGPIMLRKSLLETLGYLDDVAFAPFYQDDMDLCFRLRHNGYSVFYYPLSVENARSTIANYDSVKMRRWTAVVNKHLLRFYERWRPQYDKSTYLVLPKPRFNNLYHASRAPAVICNAPSPSLVARVSGKAAKLLPLLANLLATGSCESIALRSSRKRLIWIQEQLTFLAPGSRILHIAEDSTDYAASCTHCEYVRLAVDECGDDPILERKIPSPSDAPCLRPETFDAVLLTAIEYEAAPLITLRVVTQLLRGGGQLIIATEPTRADEERRRPYATYSKRFYESWLPRFGLSIVSVEINAGLYSQAIDTSLSAFHHAEPINDKGARRVLWAFLKIALRNLPVIFYMILDKRRAAEDAGMGYLIISEKRGDTHQGAMAA